MSGYGVGVRRQVVPPLVWVLLVLGSFVGLVTAFVRLRAGDVVLGLAGMAAVAFVWLVAIVVFVHALERTGLDVAGRGTARAGQHGQGEVTALYGKPLAAGRVVVSAGRDAEVLALGRSIAIAAIIRTLHAADGGAIGPATLGEIAGSVDEAMRHLGALPGPYARVRS